MAFTKLASRLSFPIMNISTLLSARARLIDASGIRKVFDLAAKMKDPINLSIGQPDFDVPLPIQEAACQAIREGKNKYTPTQGIAPLLEAIRSDLSTEFGWPKNDERGLLVTSGVSGGLMLAMMSLLDPGDEAIFLDPYFVMYKHLVHLVGGVCKMVEIYPDFRLPVAKIEAAITPKTKFVLLNSPSNPTGAVFTEEELKALADVARRHNVLIISDEIYNLFCYDPYHSMARYYEHVLLLRGFSKTYAMTGWRMGYAAGPAALIQEMTKLQQYTFVCAPSLAQVAAMTALKTDMSAFVTAYKKKHDRIVNGLQSLGYEVPDSGGSFYLFPRVPAKYPHAAAFVEAAIAKGLLIIPGNVFSERDTHFRISYAADDRTIERGLEVFAELMR